VARSLPRRQRYSRRLYLAEARPNLRTLSDPGQCVVVTGSLDRRLRDLEYLAELSGNRKYAVYDRMRRSDAHIYGLATALDLPIVDATWHVDPAEDSGESGKKYADWVSQALFHRMREGESWPAIIQHQLLYPYYGHAGFELCWRTDGANVYLDRLAWLPPTTLADIMVRDGRIERVVQYLANGVGRRTVDVPGEKLLWLTHQKEGDDFRGTSILRPMYRDWFSKEKAIIMFLILAERMGGLLHIVTPRNATAEDKAAADKLGKDFRVGESLYIRSPEGWDISLDGVPMELGELRSFIRDCDLAMSDAVLLQVLDLPKTDTGSRALGGTLAEMFLNSTQARAKQLADAWNARGGPIWQLMRYNFGERAADDVRPVLACGRVSRMNLAATADAILKLFQSGYPLGPEMWRFLAEEAEFPMPDEKLVQVTYEQALEPPAPSGAQVLQSGRRVEATNTAKGAAGVMPAQNAAQKRPAGQPRGYQADESGELPPFRRPPRGVELYVDFPALLTLYEGARDELRRRTEAAREAQLGKLLERADKAVLSSDARAAAAIARASAPGEERLASVCRSVFAEWLETGRRSVDDELDRQQRGEPVVATIEHARKSGQPTEFAMQDEEEEAVSSARFVEAQARTASARISQEVRTAVSQAAVMAVANKAAQGNVAQIGRTVSAASAARAGGGAAPHLVAYGREMGARENGDRIGSYVYSAMLDKNTCLTCAAMDGRETTDPSEAELWVPNPLCDGEVVGNSCRCIVIYVSGSAVAETPETLPTKPRSQMTPEEIERSRRWARERRARAQTVTREPSTVARAKVDTSLHQTPLSQQGVMSAQDARAGCAQFGAEKAYDRLTAALGDTLVFEGKEVTAYMTLHVKELASLPDNVLAFYRAKASYGLGRHVYIGKGGMPNLDWNGHMKGVHPRGWSAGATWDTIPGAQCAGSVSLGDVTHLVAGLGHGSSSLAYHEFGHALDAYARWSSKPHWMTWQNLLWSKLPPYERQGGLGGAAGMEEFVAESIALTMTGRVGGWMNDEFKAFVLKELSLL